MPRMTSEAYALWCARRDAVRQPHAPFRPDAVEREADLHDAIQAECRRRGWLAIHGRMDRASSVTVGAPGFIIFRESCKDCIAEGTSEPCRAGRVLLVECKTRTGKLSAEQVALHGWLRKLGHTVHVVRSFAEFCEAAEGKASHD